MQTIYRTLMLLVLLICHSVYAGVSNYYGGTLADCIKSQSDDMSDKKKKALCKAKKLKSLNIGKGTNQSYCISHAKNNVGKCNSVDSASAGASPTFPPQMPPASVRRWTPSDVKKIIPTGSVSLGQVSGGISADNRKYKIYRSGNNVYIRERASDGDWDYKCTFNLRGNSSCKHSSSGSNCNRNQIGNTCKGASNTTFSPTPTGLLVSTDKETRVCIKRLYHFCIQWVTASETNTRNYIWDN